MLEPPNAWPRPSGQRWTLTKEFSFEAAHQLPYHDGKCARLHGHSWRGRVICAGIVLQDGPKDGMLLDYGTMKAAIAPIIESYLDHHSLNDTLPMASPTSELVAQWLFRQLKPIFGACLVAIELDETCTSSCRYEEVADE